MVVKMRGKPARRVAPPSSQRGRRMFWPVCLIAWLSMAFFDDSFVYFERAAEAFIEDIAQTKPVLAVTLPQHVGVVGLEYSGRR
jgi:ABC-type transport system involved in cytochrome c biogenesis permease subunit